MQQTEIQLDGVNKPIRSGLVPVTDLYELADCHDKRIFSEPRRRHRYSSRCW